MAGAQIRFGHGAAYERLMGQWSRDADFARARRLGLVAIALGVRKSC